MEIIKAVFRGDDGSLGYKKDKQYKLVVRYNAISLMDGTQKCPYESLEAFLQNWGSIIPAKGIE